MTALLIVNACVLGIIGLVFGILGQNAQSRILGIVQLLVAIVNAAAAFGFVTL